MQNGSKMFFLLSWCLIVGLSITCPSGSNNFITNSVFQISGYSDMNIMGSKVGPVSKDGYYIGRLVTGSTTYYTFLERLPTTSSTPNWK